MAAPWWCSVNHPLGHSECTLRPEAMACEPSRGSACPGHLSDRRGIGHSRDQGLASSEEILERLLRTRGLLAQSVVHSLPLEILTYLILRCGRAQSQGVGDPLIKE